jgi:23S rRNA pseudouridine955/2504/2580 synthase
MAITLRTAADDEGRRLDRVLRKALPELPLSALHRLLRRGLILLDGQKARPADRVKAGSEILLPAPCGAYGGINPACLYSVHQPGSAPGLVTSTPHALRAQPQPPHSPPPTPHHPLPAILFESPELLILNKPPGLAVHGPESLDSLVQAYLAPRLPPSLSFKPGPLHRLDKPSSGIIVFSASLEGARVFSALLRGESRNAETPGGEARRGGLKKYYLALAEGRIEGPELWRDDLVRDRETQKTFTGEAAGRAASKAAGRAAITLVSPLARAPAYTLLLAEIRTGRTHQIRAQAAAHGHPLGGDRKYGGAPLPGCRGFLLHAWKLDLREAGLPPSFPALVRAPPPPAFRRSLESLFGKDRIAALLDSP